METEDKEDDSDSSTESSDTEVVAVVQDETKEPTVVELINNMYDTLEQNEVVNSLQENLLPSPGSPLIQVWVQVGEEHGASFQFIVDTGSMRTIATTAALDAKFGGMARNKMIVVPDQLPKMTAAGGKRLEVIGHVLAYLTIGDFTIMHPVIVYEDKREVCLLGNDIIKGNLTIHYGQYITFSDDRYSEVPIQYKYDVMKLEIAEDTLLLPETTMALSCKPKGESANLGMDYRTLEVMRLRNWKSQQAELPLQVLTAIVDTDDEGVCSVLVANKCPELIMLEKGTEIAEASVLNTVGKCQLIESYDAVAKVFQIATHGLRNEPMEDVIKDIFYEPEKVSAGNTKVQELMEHIYCLLAEERLAEALDFICQLPSFPLSIVAPVHPDTNIYNNTTENEVLKHARLKEAVHQSPIAVIEFFENMLNKELMYHYAKLLFSLLKGEKQPELHLTNDNLTEMYFVFIKYYDLSRAYCRIFRGLETLLKWTDEISDKKAHLIGRFYAEKQTRNIEKDILIPMAVQMNQKSIAATLLKQNHYRRILLRKLHLISQALCSQKAYDVRQEAHFANISLQDLALGISGVQYEDTELRPVGVGQAWLEASWSQTEKEYQYAPEDDRVPFAIKSRWEVTEDELAELRNELSQHAECSLLDTEMSCQELSLDVTKWLPKGSGQHLTEQEKSVVNWLQLIDRAYQEQLELAQLKKELLEVKETGECNQMQVDDVEDMEPILKETMQVSKALEADVSGTDEKVLASIAQKDQLLQADAETPVTVDYLRQVSQELQGVKLRSQSEDEIKGQEFVTAPDEKVLHNEDESEETKDQSKVTVTVTSEVKPSEADTVLMTPEKEEKVDTSPKWQIYRDPTEEPGTVSIQKVFPERKKPKKTKMPSGKENVKIEIKDGIPRCTDPSLSLTDQMKRQLYPDMEVEDRDWHTFDPKIASTPAKTQGVEESTEPGQESQSPKNPKVEAFKTNDPFEGTNKFIHIGTYIVPQVDKRKYSAVLQDQLVVMPQELMRTAINTMIKSAGEYYIHVHKVVNAEGEVEINIKFYRMQILNEEEKKLREHRAPDEVVLAIFNCDLRQEEENVLFVQDHFERREILEDTQGRIPMPRGVDIPDQVEANWDWKPDPDWMDQIALSHLTFSLKQKVLKIVKLYPDAFAKSEYELGRCRYFTVSLKLIPGSKPHVDKYRPVNERDKQILKKSIDKLILQRAIRPSKSAWAANLVLVKKVLPDGSTKYRAAYDARGNNKVIEPIAFSMPHISENMCKLSKGKIRSFIDVRQAFNQLGLDPNSVGICAFYGVNNDKWEYTVLPFGLQISLASFMMMMNMLVGDLPFVIVFVDDLVINTIPEYPGQPREELEALHLKQFEIVCARFAHANVLISPDKCMLMVDAKEEVAYLGHTLKGQFNSPHEAKVKVLDAYPPPKNDKQASSFLGLCGWYRKYIPAFSVYTKPIEEARLARPFIWTRECQAGFLLLKEKLKNAPLLLTPNPDYVSLIYCDANENNIGGVMMQYDPCDKEGEKGAKPVAWAARRFSKTERNLPSPAKECLAILYCIILWYPYLQGTYYKVYTDCRAWYFLLACRGYARWARIGLSLGEANPRIVFVPGSRNVCADAMSRAWDEMNDSTEVENVKWTTAEMEAMDFPKRLQVEGKVWTYDELMHAMEPDLQKQIRSRAVEKDLRETNANPSVCAHVKAMDATLARMSTPGSRPFQFKKLKSLDNDTIRFDPCYEKGQMPELTELALANDQSCRIAMVATRKACFSVKGFAKLQRADDKLGAIVQSIFEQSNVPLKEGYYLRHGILMKMYKSNNGTVHRAVVVPEKLVPTLLKSNHETLQGLHASAAQMLLYMRKYFFWNGMRRDIKRHCDKCFVCKLNKDYPVKIHRGSLLIPSFPMDIVYIDIMSGMETSSDNKKSLVVIVDAFSKFLHAIPMSTTKSEYVAKEINERFFQIAGHPKRLISDVGANVDSDIINWLSRLSGIRKQTTQSYTPRSDLAETMCKRLGKYLRNTLCQVEKKNWSVIVPQLVIAHNFTPSLTTNYTPAEVFLGRVYENYVFPLITPEEPAVSKSEYVEAVRKATFYRWMVVRERLQLLSYERAKYENVKAYQHDFECGDIILVKDMHPKMAQTRKLHEKRYGPMIVVAVSEHSLCAIPLQEGERLADLGLDGNKFKLHHQGEVDSKPFIYQKLPIDHCIKVPVEDLELPPDYHPEVVKEFLKVFDLKWDMEERLIFEKDDPRDKPDIDEDSWNEDDSVYWHFQSHAVGAKETEISKIPANDMIDNYAKFRHHLDKLGLTEKTNTSIPQIVKDTEENIAPRHLPQRPPGPLDEVIYDDASYKLFQELAEKTVTGKTKLDEILESRTTGQQFTAIEPGLYDAIKEHQPGVVTCACDSCKAYISERMKIITDEANKLAAKRLRVKSKTTDDTELSPASTDDPVSSSKTWLKKSASADELFRVPSQFDTQSSDESPVDVSLGDKMSSPSDVVTDKSPSSSDVDAKLAKLADNLSSPSSSSPTTHDASIARQIAREEKEQIKLRLQAQKDHQKFIDDKYAKRRAENEAARKMEAETGSPLPRSQRHEVETP